MLLNLNIIRTRSNWFCWKAQEKFQTESRCCKTIACSYVTLLTTHLVKKKQCSKLATETLGKDVYWFQNNIKNLRMMSPDYYLFAGGNCPEPCLGTVPPRTYTNFQSKVCFQFCFQVRRPVISTILDPYISFYEKWEIITEIFHSWKFKMSAFFYFWKNGPKTDKFFNFLSYIQRVAISVSQS